MPSKVIYRSIDEDMPTIVKGHGHWIETHDGKWLLDYSSGPCCFSLGHSNQFVKAAIASQMRDFPSAFSGFWRSNAAETAGQLICDKFEAANKGWFGGVIFQNAGGEAVDFACKLAAQFHLEAGLRKQWFAVRDYSFHGVGLLPAALSGYYPRYNLIAPYQQSTSTNHTLRVPHSITSPDALAKTRYLIKQFRHCLAALIIEPVGGPPVGAYPETKDYLHGLRDICDEFEVLLVFDEILCGSGRCGYLSVAEHYDVWPDICLLGKGLSAGYQPVSAIVINDRVRDRIESGSGSLTWGTTYSAHSMGCAAVSATLGYMNEKGLWDWVRNKGDELQSALEYDLKDVPMVRSIRGLGYLRGIELVNPRTGEPFPAKLEQHRRVRKAVYNKGVVVYTKGQTVNGAGDYIIVAPPLEITRDEIYIGASKIRAALEEIKC